MTFVNLFTPACLSVFQSTHLHEVWLFAVIPKAITDSFNPHTYMRCDCMWSTWNTVLACFNPHTYMRCDLSMNVLSTLYRGFNPHTYMRCDLVWLLENFGGVFQSTHLHEVWQVEWRNQTRTDSVSIHTPTWGVTSPCRTISASWLFQSTHLHEVWLAMTYQEYNDRRFQSTHLHEVWPFAVMN